MECTDVASVDNVGAEDSGVEVPAAEAVDAPMTQGEEEVAEPAPATDDAEARKRLNGASREDAAAEESVPLVETSSTEATAPVPEVHTEAVPESSVKMDTSPLKGEASPVKMVTSPTKTASSPAKPATLPAKLAASPTKLATSPIKMAPSPTKLATSPTKLATSPTKLVTSPTKLATSPTKKAVSPAKSATSPAKMEVSPAKPETSPVKKDSSPARTELDDEAVEVASPRGQKRRASRALSDASDEFRGFAKGEASLDDSVSHYSSLVDKMAAEVAAEEASLTPVRRVPAPRLLKRQRTDDGSRSSSSLSHRSEDAFLSEMGASSPAGGRGRRTAPEALASPLFRVPLERGWKRELVYRAALDQHSRRNADIYYYTPAGKKLRSSREISDHIAGSGLTLDHFTFFKEPLGLDDPDKEIIRDAKVRDSPQSSPAPAPAPVEGKRTPKPKQPKGVSPEPRFSGPPTKIKVKSVGSRLSTGRVSTGGDKGAATNNNTPSSWKKPRLVVPPPPPLVCRPASPVTLREPQGGGLRPCSMRCEGAAAGSVPSLACSVCLCLYHPSCAGHTSLNTANFLCKNCRVLSGPPPLMHKSGSSPPPPPPPLTPAPSLVLRAVPPPPAGVAVRRYPVPRPVPVRRAPPPPAPPPAAAPPRVFLRMKAHGGGGEKVWAVQPMSGAPAPPPPPPPLVPAPSAAPHAPHAPSAAPLPQGVAIINGRKFIVVPRNTARSHTPGTPNGDAGSGKRRGRPPSAVDHFTPFYNKAQGLNYGVVAQIFQYVGMRDLARCARVCRLWRTMAATPALWRHVRMKNSQVSDWGGLCAALARHGTRRLDLRKMLLPQNDEQFWKQFADNIATVATLERLELCRCPASAVEAVCRGLGGLRQLGALAVRDARLDPAPLAQLTQLCDLRIKSMSGLTLTSDLTPLANLKHLQHLSLTSIKELGGAMCGVVVGSLRGLVELELGECTFGAEFGRVLARLAALRRLRLERGTADCDAPALLRALATLPQLATLELVNFDVKPGFDEALAQCRNIQRLLIIPTYVSQSATTNRQVLSGVLRLKDTLTHLMWGVTIELLRVTELFIDQCEGKGAKRSKLDGQSIPVLKPVPGYSAVGDAQQKHSGPPQVEILPLPTLQSLLSTSLPTTKLKLLKIPFHATWRQSLADFQ